MVRRTKSEAEETRHRLMDAAEQLFLERGVSHTSLNDIASAAGATRGAIYWHFTDKADLFHALMERVTLPMEQVARAASEKAQGECSPLHHILLAIQTALHTTAHDPRTRRVFEIATHKIERVGVMSSVGERQLACQRGFITAIESALAATAVQTGQPLPIPTPVAAMGLQMLVDGLIRNWLVDPAAFDLEVVGLQTVQTYLRGLGLTVPELDMTA